MKKVFIFLGCLVYFTFPIIKNKRTWIPIEKKSKISDPKPEKRKSSAWSSNSLHKLVLLFILFLMFMPTKAQTQEETYAEYMAKESYQEIDTSGIDSLNCDSFVTKLTRTQVKIGFTSSVIVDPKAIISVKNSDWNILLQKDSIYFEFLSDTTAIVLLEGNLFKRSGHWWCYCTKDSKDWYIDQIGLLRQQLE